MNKNLHYLRSQRCVDATFHSHFSFQSIHNIKFYFEKFEGFATKKTSSTSMDINLCGGLRYPNQFHGMTREKLRMISPGGISLLRLIRGLVVRMPIPHLVAFPAVEETEKTETRTERPTERGRPKSGTEGRRREENSIWSNTTTYQTSVGPHLPRLLYRRLSRYVHIGDIRSRTHSSTSEDGSVALWW